MIVSMIDRVGPAIALQNLKAKEAYILKANRHKNTIAQTCIPVAAQFNWSTSGSETKTWFCVKSTSNYQCWGPVMQWWAILRPTNYNNKNIATEFENHLKLSISPRVIQQIINNINNVEKKSTITAREILIIKKYLKLSISPGVIQQMGTRPKGSRPSTGESNVRLWRQIS